MGKKASQDKNDLDASGTLRKRENNSGRIGHAKYKVILESIPLGITISDKNGNIVETNSMAEHLLGLPKKEQTGRKIDGREWHIIRPDGSPMPADEYASVRALKENRLVSDVEMGIVKGDGDITWIEVTSAPIPLEGYGVIIIYKDITRQKVAEDAVRKFGAELEGKVAERTSKLLDDNLKMIVEISTRLEAEKQLSKTVCAKDILLREVHHRVKNNLQIIISLLNLQSRYMTDETTLSAFVDCQNRIKAMALVHEKLYQSENASTIDLDNYVRFIGTNLIQFSGMKGKGITLTNDIRNIALAIDTAIPIGLIINELISNSVKHAFPDGRKGEISLVIHRQEHTITILYKDNGIGIPENFDWRNAKSLGLRLVVSLVEQLQGTIEMDRTAGTMFTIVVKEKE